MKSMYAIGTGFIFRPNTADPISKKLSGKHGFVTGFDPESGLYLIRVNGHANEIAAEIGELQVSDLSAEKPAQRSH